MPPRSVATLGRRARSVSSTAAAPVASVESVEPERVQVANGQPVRAERRYVLYWVQASVRAVANHALEYAVARANALGRPLVACFGLTSDYPEANARHYAFLVEGVLELRAELLRRRGVALHVLLGAPDRVAEQCARGSACEVVGDVGYLRVQRQWRAWLAAALDCRLTLVESEAVVPVRTASDRPEFAARTLRPRLRVHLDRFCRAPAAEQRLQHADPAVHVDHGPFRAMPDASVDAVLLQLAHLDRSVAPVSPRIRGGAEQALRQLDRFCTERLARYVADRNNPAADGTSRLSAYLHFGHISPITVALAVRRAAAAASGALRASADAFLEELIVRRELSFNHCWYRPDEYDRLSCLPDWVQRTRAQHARDPRVYVYGLAEIEAARTHDAYWNAAQREMCVTGHMHGMMRMYWAKKVIEWTDSWEHAYDWLIYLNNKYELDGRDANSFVGVLWSFGLHDRAHAERPIFGKLRWMSHDGLTRKFPMAAYLARVAELAPDAAPPAHAAKRPRL